MSYLRFLPIFFLLLAWNSYAEVPNVFTAGTTARASEVNENFQVLNEGIEVLEGRMGTVEDKLSRAACSSEDLTTPYHPITYTPKTSALGDRILAIDQPDPNHSDHAYRIIELPIVEFGTGDVYKVRVPARADESLGETYLGHRITTYHSTGALDCANLEIAGYPAFSQGIRESQLYFLNNGDGETGGSEIVINYDTELQVQIGETVIVYKIEIGASQTGWFPVINGDYDLTDNIDSSGIAPRDDIRQIIDDLIDYIKITKWSDQ